MVEEVPVRDGMTTETRLSEWKPQAKLAVLASILVLGREGIGVQASRLAIKPRHPCWPGGIR